ncbi:hypothetical protein VOLCADRAFT_118098 [Volvox carteri f. nagariensis]|uniref:Phosphoglycerate mutase-like protein n=1 Tax=Volvox carteri f. nagariensis TaxID=3068 RepID=D8U177_VOLCA|nr:uncharacterized protein VOLCADRAFT_118098 [Volvox carteri f. nagariensis]EFJ46586.1 hypothetical protein VOLCADRAFT_118098 [Volvox carteri f. nagariensis]|eukprot:XP_002952443.1 hypothetical protein VOLCADRAFT_118098 [Volvox carteri f. nagariensis]
MQEQQPAAAVVPPADAGWHSHLKFAGDVRQGGQTGRNLWHESAERWRQWSRTGGGGKGVVAAAATNTAAACVRRRTSTAGGSSGSEGPDGSGSRAGDGGGSSEAGGGKSPKRVVSEHVARQQSAAASQLDPVGAHDSSQQVYGAASGAQTSGHYGLPPPLDDLRPPLPPPQQINSQAETDAVKRVNWGADSASEGEDGLGGGGGGGGGASGPSWVGQTVWAVPCSTVGYGTRAEVVARLPASIMLLRHAECMTLDELQAHERVPNHDIPLSRLCPHPGLGGILAEELEEEGLVSGVREAVQLREQDWGNFQDPRVQADCKEERLRYGRFYYRFPSGESVADVYDRLTIFQDHLVRDMCAGRFAENTCVAIVSHGLTLRVFAMRWLHWTVRQFLQVYNIPNAEPVLLHKDVHPSYLEGDHANLPFMPHHTKCLYRLTPRALELMRGADCSMATSNGCWHTKVLAQPTALNAEEEDRLWADVDGMV